MVRRPGSTIGYDAAPTIPPSDQLPEPERLVNSTIGTRISVELRLQCPILSGRGGGATVARLYRSRFMRGFSSPRLERTYPDPEVQAPPERGVTKNNSPREAQGHCMRVIVRVTD